ncbi:MAG: hypothetical protein HY033_07440 [Ignavibacteriae bacterium]|nr:hypothetical protein [Ignavibacteria bacterium]MBI3364726.1 hypothetical protein [Ignavibacteriota bacterium]
MKFTFLSLLCIASLSFDEIKKFREEWLGSTSAEKLPELMKWCPTCKRDYPFSLEFCSFDGDTLRVVREGQK